MRVRSSASRVTCLLSLLLAVPATMAVAPTDQKSDQKADQNKKPSISVRANPPVGFSPMRVVLTAELKGGANDYEDFYCASVEWDWDDGTKSEVKGDCDPYEPGKSEIKRRYVQEHTFRSYSNNMPGSEPTGPVQVRVRFVLKQKNKVVGSGQTMIELRSGMGGQ